LAEGASACASKRPRGGDEGIRKAGALGRCAIKCEQYKGLDEAIQTATLPTVAHADVKLGDCDPEAARGCSVPSRTATASG
jgi:hypothetical protein